jgi:DNA-binding transcriptional regulator YiaG
MTTTAIKEARQSLGLSVADLARMLDTDPQTVRRMEQREDASTFRKPAPRMVRLITAYLDGYRPTDWPSQNTLRPGKN